MALEIECPFCAESEDLAGVRRGDAITITCGGCGETWDRPTSPTCPNCDATELQAVPHAIVEKSRGTQLSVVGIRVVHLCFECDAADIRRWQDSRPNPLMPSELPTVGPEQG